MSIRSFITPDDSPQIETPFHAFRRTLGTTDKMLMLEMYFPRDTVVPEHSHIHDQIGYVVRGQIEVTIAGETRMCHPGDSYAIPGDVLHSARTPVDTLIVEIFAPVREEFRLPPTE